MLMFAVFMIALLAILPTAYQVMSTSRKSTQNIISKQRVGEIAAIGLESATGWFKRQTIQPVGSSKFPVGTYGYPDAAFNPIVDVDPVHPTPQGGTLDSSIGLVDEFELNSEKKLWARYEVRRQNDPALTSIDSHAAHDITPLRFPGQPAGSGRAWAFASKGIAFIRNNPAVPYNVPPNRIIDSIYAYSEIVQLDIETIVPCALLIPSAADPAGTSLDLLTTIDGGANPGIVTFNSVGFNAHGAVVNGSPSVQSLTAFPINAESIFQATLSDLYRISDDVVDTRDDPDFSWTTKTKTLIADDRLVYIKSTSDAYVLKSNEASSGILFVEGPITLEGYFKGIVFVDGNVNCRGFSVRGQLIVNGSLKILPNPLNGQHTINTIVYDSEAIRKAIFYGGRYRKTKTMMTRGPL